MRAPLDTMWRKASCSSPDNACVEIARTAPVVGIRDSKAPDAGQLAVTPAAFDAFLRRECELRH